MKKIAIAMMGAFAFGGVQAAAPNWENVPEMKATLFYPGQASIEWVFNKPDHPAVGDIIEKKAACASCHIAEGKEIGDKIAAGKPVGKSGAVVEPKPIAGKVGSVPVIFKAAHDGEKIYFRVEWNSPKGGAPKMDKKNDVKVALMFDGGGTVEGANLNGCWATCHDDMRSMKTAKDDKKTKYIKDADLAGGKFYDLIQFKSGKGEKPADGYVADKRVMEGGKALVKAEGKKEGDKWVVIFERKLAGGGTGDHNITADKIYNFGIAIHEDATEARYHHVSVGYQFGLDAETPKDAKGKPVKNFYKVAKQ